MSVCVQGGTHLPCGLCGRQSPACVPGHQAQPQCFPSLRHLPRLWSQVSFSLYSEEELDRVVLSVDFSLTTPSGEEIWLITSIIDFACGGLATSEFCNTFLKIYLFIMYTVFSLHVLPQSEESKRSHYRWLWATMQVLGIELRTSGRAASAINHWAISPAPPTKF